MSLTALILAASMQAQEGRDFTCMGSVHPNTAGDAWRGQVTLRIETPRGLRTRQAVLTLGQDDGGWQRGETAAITHCAGRMTAPPQGGVYQLESIDIRLDNGSRFTGAGDVVSVTMVAEGNPEG